MVGGLGRRALVAVTRSFSRGSRASILDGKGIADGLKANLKEEIAQLRSTPGNETWTPGLAIVQVGNRADSNVYIKHKINAGAKLGMDVQHFKLDSDTREKHLLDFIKGLNANDKIDGIIVQLPLDAQHHIDVDHVIDSIYPHKDVDGLTRANAGRLARGELEGAIVPCTPRGCLHLVQEAGVPVEGKRVVVLGRSKIVGGPAAALFTWHHATATICHSKTRDLHELARQADILLVAMGKAEAVRGDWIQPGAVVVDCGINVLEGKGEGGKNKLVGDVAFEEALDVASWLTPVPGGVGPMTVTMLLANTVQQAKRRLARSN